MLVQRLPLRELLSVLLGLRVLLSLLRVWLLLLVLLFRVLGWSLLAWRWGTRKVLLQV